MDELLLAVANIVLPKSNHDDEIGKIYPADMYPDRDKGMFSVVQGKVCRWTVAGSGGYFWEVQTQGQEGVRDD